MLFFQDECKEYVVGGSIAAGSNRIVVEANDAGDAWLGGRLLTQIDHNVRFAVIKWADVREQLRFRHRPTVKIARVE